MDRRVRCHVKRSPFPSRSKRPSLLILLMCSISAVTTSLTASHHSLPCTIRIVHPVLSARPRLVKVLPFVKFTSKPKPPFTFLTHLGHAFDISFQSETLQIVRRHNPLVN